MSRRSPERRLVSVHLEEFPSAVPRQVPEAEPVDRRAVSEALRAQALSGIP
ncbi:MAG: hypothetical protein M3R38_09185 [Actinomycetota bacterium]|nr:hypothetical protein [Actinomycetota bacterium]